MASERSISLWVRSEVFTFGALPVPPHSKLSSTNLKRIIPYAKNKGKSGFPRINYAVWKHIACDKLQLPADLSWMYFTTFETLLNEMLPEERMERDNRLASFVNSPEIAEKVRGVFSVPTLKFVLFLHMQQLHKINLRSSLLSGDEWPSRASSPDPTEGRSTPRGGKSMDEHAHLNFVLNNLVEIMSLLSEPYASGEEGSRSDSRLSPEAVEALGFLIEGSIDNNRNLKPLLEIASLQHEHDKTSYSEVNVETSRIHRSWKMVICRNYSCQNLENLLRSHLVLYPFGVSTCISQGRRLSWPLAGEDKETRAKNGRIATNALIIPRNQTGGYKLIVMSQVNKQTVARCSGTLEKSHIKIHRCHHSYIYLLSPLRCVRIEKCQNTIIVLGAVEIAVNVVSCDQVTIIAACKRIGVSGSTRCTFHLLIPTRPLIFNGNDSLQFAPYHTFYPKLREHMDSVGLGVEMNLWDQPLCLGAEQQEDSSIWQLLDPKDFYVFKIPFEMEGSTQFYPINFPSKYKKALVQREQVVARWQHTLRESALTDRQRLHFKNVVEAGFQEWLVDTGHKRQLDTLVPCKKAS